MLAAALGLGPAVVNGTEPHTPVSAEQSLREFSDALEGARLALERTRKRELDRKHERDAAKRRAMLSEACPKVGANLNGARVTVAFVAAWTEEQVAREQLAYDLATMERQAAQEHLRTLREQGSLQQSISRSVAQSYQQGNGSGRW